MLFEAHREDGCLVHQVGQRGGAPARSHLSHLQAKSRTKLSEF